MPDVVARKLPKHPIPAALPGRLAVSARDQGCGIGGLLLADAIKRTLAISDTIGIHALVVDALNEQAETFYQTYGFTALARHRRFYLPLKSIPIGFQDAGRRQLA